jgi:CheY-like chemotaxis protein
MSDASPDDRAATPRLRVLVAEDDDDLRALLIDCLEKEGYRAIELEDGFELGDYLELSNRKVSKRLQPDVVITDVQMPGRTGLDVLREARQQGLTSPCIVISGFADESLREEDKKLEPAFVLAKPFDLDEVVALVARVAGR